MGEDRAGSRSELAWQGAQAAGRLLGAKTERVSPRTAAEAWEAVSAAVSAVAPSGTTVVVVVGPAGARAALAAAPGHPAIIFFVVDSSLAPGAPPNVHGLVFDDGQAGYLAGYVAARVSPTGSVGFVAGTKADAVAAGYLAGMRSGALQARPDTAVNPAYAGTPDDPQKGRAAVDGLAASGVGAVVAMPDLTGYGAMRQACARGLPLVALETEAAALLPDVRPCLVVSILRRYDTAVRDAVIGYAAGRATPQVAIGTVASGGIVPGPFARYAAPDLAVGLQDVLAALRAAPSRATPTSAAATSTPDPSLAPST